MAIQTEVWAKEIAEKLFPDNMFMSASKDDSAFVENKTVHQPQAGAVPSVVRNRSTIPATAVRRTDTVGDYDIDEFTSTPTVIQDIEEIETSYAKRASVLSDHTTELNRQIANWMAYHWAATNASNIVRTTGSSRASFVAGATGNRKKITLDDWLRAKRILDNMDLPDDGNRYALVPAEIYNDLLEIDKILSREFNISGRLPMGVVNEIFNIKIFKRSATVRYSNAANPVLISPDAPAMTTANAGIIMWHSDFVKRALGATKVYHNDDDATMYGSVFSAMVRAGGSKKYVDQTGVVAIVESAA